MDSRVLILATIFLSLLSLYPSQIHAADLKLLEKVCDGSKDPKFCVETLKADPKTESFSAWKAVCEIAVAFTRKVSTETRDFFNAKVKSDPNKVFELCASFFDKTIWQLNIGGLEDGTASLDIHYAYDSVTYCKTALSDAKINDPTVTAKIEEWRNVYSVASSAVDNAEALH